MEIFGKPESKLSRRIIAALACFALSVATAGCNERVVKLKDGSTVTTEGVFLGEDNNGNVLLSRCGVQKIGKENQAVDDPDSWTTAANMEAASRITALGCRFLIQTETGNVKTDCTRIPKDFSRGLKWGRVVKRREYPPTVKNNYAQVCKWSNGELLPRGK